MHRLREKKCYDGWITEADGTHQETVVCDWVCQDCGKTFVHPEALGEPETNEDCREQDKKWWREKQTKQKEAHDGNVRTVPKGKPPQRGGKNFRDMGR